MKITIEYDEQTEVLDILCDPPMNPDEVQEWLKIAYEQLNEETEAVH